MRSHFAQKFGDMVRRARDAKNLSQEELGFQIGLHKNYIGFVERAERNISLEKAIKLIQYLDLNIEELYEKKTSKSAT